MNKPQADLITLLSILALILTLAFFMPRKATAQPQALQGQGANADEALDALPP